MFKVGDRVKIDMKEVDRRTNGGRTYITGVEKERFEKHQNGKISGLGIRENTFEYESDNGLHWTGLPQSIFIKEENT